MESCCGFLLLLLLLREGMMTACLVWQMREHRVTQIVMLEMLREKIETALLDKGSSFE